MGGGGGGGSEWMGGCVCVCGGVPFPLRFHSPSALTVFPRCWGKKIH